MPEGQGEARARPSARREAVKQQRRHLLRDLPGAVPLALGQLPEGEDEGRADEPAGGEGRIEGTELARLGGAPEECLEPLHGAAELPDEAELLLVTIQQAAVDQAAAVLAAPDQLDVPPDEGGKPVR